MEELTELIRLSSKILVFTGAGVSTGSGIPDFRGPNGLWKRRKPVYFSDFLQSEEARIEHWDYKLEAFKLFQHARPNSAHVALVSLERLGKLHTLVTQNIDGLHQVAGNNPELVIELHGTNRYIECLTCGALTDPEPAFEEFLKTGASPRCQCGGLQKTATISFGQEMPQEELNRAFRAAEEADLVISVGSTLEVEPAASVPLAAARSGVPYVIVNQGATAHDSIATLRIEGDVTEVLPQAVEQSQK